MKLKGLQKESQYSIRQNAEKLGMPFSTYNNYLLGVREPDIATLIKLANYFDVSLDYLVGRQFNNKIGHMPNEKFEAVKNLISLNGEAFDKASEYILKLKEENK